MSEENKKRLNDAISQLYNQIVEKPLQVLDICNDFFGEERVDMQECCTEDEFKVWLDTEPITTYIKYSGYTNYYNKSITNLPLDLLNKILKDLQKEDVVKCIASLKFNNIFILIHFPHVRVTNEHNRFVDINHLWAKFGVLSSGKLSNYFYLNRSEYSLLHFTSNYLHSHVPSIPKLDFTQFQSPCTGTGPIRNTICTLHKDFDKDMWQLFCLELSKYVTVESIAGTPYKLLERLGTDNKVLGINKYTVFNRPLNYDINLDTEIKDFIKYFISTKKLRFNYVNNSYSIGMSFIEFIILFSNEFIKWYNQQFNEGKVSVNLEDLKRHGIIKECIIDNNKIYYETEVASNTSYLSYIGNKVCTFKGKEITLNITDVTEINNKNKSLIFCPQTALYILNKILQVLNYRYGRKTKDTNPSAKVRYL